MSKHPENFVQELFYYFRYEFGDELKSFSKWVRYYLVLWIAAGAAILGLFAYLDIGTNSTAVLGYAQSRSSYRDIAESYERFFEKDGLHLDLADVSHIGDSADQLQRDSAPLNASFVLAGSMIEANNGRYQSLGSIKFAPGWFFYRGPTISGPGPFVGMAGKRVSIGPAGSFSNRFMRELYALAKPPGVGDIQILELTDTDAAVALLKGDIDAMWTVDGIASENIKQLIASPDLQLFSWQLADAYVEKLPYLSKLKLPAGYFDIGNTRPPTDLTLLSTTVTLLIEADLHPALQWGFLLAARDYQSSHYDDLSAGVTFPTYMDKSVPLSPVAERYFNEGVPTIFSYLPIFYASLVERIWIWLLGAFLLGYPIFHTFMHYREFHARWNIMHNFERLRSYEERVVEAQDVEELNELVSSINAFEAEILGYWVAEENLKDYYLLRAAFGRAREAIAFTQKRLAQ